jgi:GNAT superfamily N-acetyltransferase
VIRPARPDDVPTILALIRELAAYEREPAAVVATQGGLEAALFGERAALFGLIAEHPGADGPVIAGFALWFLNFSTWVGRHGIYLEDLYVRPELRGQGYGVQLLVELARIADERGYGRLEWAVLDWNDSAHRFYESLGAVPMQEWTIWRVSGDALPKLAQRSASASTSIETRPDADGRA